MELPDDQVYVRIGDEGFDRLIAAFYRRVPGDDVLGPMYANSDIAAAQWRLREFLVGRFGGPPRYIGQRGHPRLRMRHHPFEITPAARDRWMQLMTAALEEAQLDAEAVVTLRNFFASSATFMINRP